MSYSNISVSLTDEQKAKLNQSVLDLQQTLSFLINLTPLERQNLRKMGDKRTSYVLDVLRVALANPSVIPSSLNLDEYARDVSLLQNLQDLLVKLESLTEALDDTVLALGNEAIKATDQCYTYLKQAAKSNSNLNVAVQELGARFKQTRATIEDEKEIAPAPTPAPAI